MGPLLLSHVWSTAFGQLQVRGVTFVEALGWQPRRLIRDVAQSGVTSGDGGLRPETARGLELCCPLAQRGRAHGPCVAPGASLLVAPV